MSFTVTQRFNRRSIGFLWDKRGTLDPGQVEIINSIYNNKKKGDAGIAEQTITYKLSNKNAGKLGYGRLYGTKGSFETLEKECRGTICKEYYDDIDIINCHPTILVQFAKTKFNVDLPEVEKYVENRELYLKNVMTENDVSRDEAKQAIISILYGGSCSNESFLNDLSVEVRNFSKKLFKVERYDDLARACRTQDNIYGSFLSFVLQTEERHMMLAMKEKLEADGWSVDVLCYDGVMIRKREGVVCDLKGCEKAITEKTGYIVALTTKEFSSFDIPPTPEEMVKGVSREAYNTMKEKFEKTHFYHGPSNQIGRVVDNEIQWMNLDHSRELLSRDWRFQHSEKFEDYTTFFDIWRKDPNRRVIQRIDMRESDDPNTFVLPPRFAWTEEGDVADITAVEKFLEIIELFGNEEQQRYIIRWMAQIVQKPFERCGTALVISGDKRTGKDTPFDFLMMFVFGMDYCTNYSCSGLQFFDKHDVGRMNKLFCKVEEANRRVFMNNADKFKSLITADSEMYNHKGKSPVTVANYNRFVLTTNGACPVELADGEQRYVVATCSNARKHDIPYWTEVRKVLFNKEAGRAVGKWLYNLDISDFQFRIVPVEEFQNTIVESEATSEDLFVKEWDGAETPMIDFYNQYRCFCAERSLPMCMNSKSFGMALLKLLRNKTIMKKHTENGKVYWKR